MSRHILWKKGDEIVLVGYEPGMDVVFMNSVGEDRDGKSALLAKDTFPATSDAFGEVMDRAQEHCSITINVRNSVINYMVEECMGISDRARVIDWTKGIPIEIGEEKKQ